MNLADVVYLLFAIAIAAYVAFAITAAVVDSDTRAYVNQSEAWCEDHGGELWNENALVHGGLHCRLPNGTVVHMDEVIGP